MIQGAGNTGAFVPKGAAMTNQEIFELMARFDQSGITSFKLTTKDVTLELGKGAAAPAASASAPDAEPFVKVGDKVKKGQTVCLMEAMKMMNEVQAPCDCVIEAVLQEDGALVSFGDPLIRYREG